MTSSFSGVRTDLVAICVHKYRRCYSLAETLLQSPKTVSVYMKSIRTIKHKSPYRQYHLSYWRHGKLESSCGYSVIIET